MNMMSSDNTYYRYELNSPADILPETLLRRRNKAHKNNKNSFLYTVLTELLPASKSSEFLKSNMKTHDLLLIDFDIFTSSAALFQNFNFYLNFSKAEQIKKFKSVADQSLFKVPLIFTPVTTDDFLEMQDFFVQAKTEQTIYWQFRPFNKNIPRSVGIADINKSKIKFNLFPNVEIYNSNAPSHYELQPCETDETYSVKWSLQSKSPRPKLSIIIPSYNNSQFLSNVVWHLINQNLSQDLYEVIIVDDGSLDHSAEVLQELFTRHRTDINIKFIYWHKTHPKKGDQTFFRSGLARNLAVHHSCGEFLFFLDSDMLVPPHFAETVLENFKNADVIQFQRFHINQNLSKTNPSYQSINISKDTYIEEQAYWSVLFNCDQWESLRHYWKYTCTYALGISRKNFYEIGLFKKYYVSYGFEDTDLGYEAYKRRLRFHLVKVPLLHLTAYDLMQYKNSFSKRVKLLRVTAELFYLQHLNQDVYDLLGDYLRFQKPFMTVIKEFFD
ncbi:MAG: glycosyltransferase family 2 protein [Pseudobdellovibrio sp.]